MRFVNTVMINILQHTCGPCLTQLWNKTTQLPLSALHTDYKTNNKRPVYKNPTTLSSLPLTMHALRSDGSKKVSAKTKTKTLRLKTKTDQDQDIEAQDQDQDQDSEPTDPRPRQ